MKGNQTNMIVGYTWEAIQRAQQGGALRDTVKIEPGKDYGADPVGDGTFRMIPSGEIVTRDERNKRLGI